MRIIVDEKINPILDKYVAETRNMSMNPGEQTLWVHEVTKGVHEETVEKWVITNLRAFKFYPQAKNTSQGRLRALEPTKALSLTLYKDGRCSQFQALMDSEYKT